MTNLANNPKLGFDNEGKKMEKIAEDLIKENSYLRHIISEIWWMARRYAHGRKSYSVGQYNNAIRLAQLLGMKFKPDPIDGLIEAKDVMFDKE
jgi:hypothetical protein